MLTALGGSSLSAQTADEIMKQVRFRQAQQRAEFNGRLRTGQTKVPFHLQIEGPSIRYSFKDPQRILQLRLGNKSAELEEVVGDSATAVVPSRLSEHLFGTDVTMEDISLQFIYWPDAEVIDAEDKVQGRPAWKIRLKSPTKHSQYGYVDLWVDKQSGAFTQATGYNKEGDAIRQFKLVKIQKVGNTWFMKEMRIMNPSTRSLTYLEVEKP